MDRESVKVSTELMKKVRQIAKRDGRNISVALERLLAFALDESPEAAKSK